VKTHPESGGVLQYHVKAKIDGHERVVREDQLDRWPDVRTHPNAEAIYEVVLLDAGRFGVRISIPGTNPTTVSSFDSEAAAEVWIT
jgi:hypothetical protein